MNRAGLSEQDVAALLTNVSDSEAAIGKLGTRFAQPTMSPAERQAAEQIMRAMLKGAEVKVRKMLAETLKDSSFLPHDIAVALAHDIEQIALPVLQFSAVLTDEDLIEVVRAGHPGKQVAIAGRPSVSSAVAGELIQTDNSLAVARLVANPGAALSDEQIEKAATRFSFDPRVAESLGNRPNLPLSIAEQLISYTLDSLRALIARRTDLADAAVNQLVLRMREQMTVDMRSPYFPAAEAVELVRHLHAANRLTPSLLLRAVCVGDIGLLEAGLAELTKVPVHNARVLIHDSGPLGFKTLYERSGLPASYFPAFDVALQVSREVELSGLEHDLEHYRRTTIERILTQFEALGAEDLDYLLIRLDDPLPQAAARTGTS
jgi:uncharacterized protein (DUF2336 family)